MRSWVCVALFALCCVVAVHAQADADDAALLQLGIDLSAHSAAAPMPTYVTSKPLGHDAATIAKFPMLHEIKGLEAKDWSDIQSLLFREPPAAAESNLDMKLDELEVKFNKLDTKPVPSPIAPKGSTLLPNLNKPEMGLRATLPKKRGKKGLRMKQKGKKSKKAAAKKAASKAQAKAAAPAAAAKPAAPAKAPAASAPAAATSEAASTVRLIEKRIKGLSQLFSRLKTQIGIDAAKAKKAKKAGKKSGKRGKKSGKKGSKGSKAGKSSKPKKKLSDTQLINNALSKHRKDKKELARRMAARRARFAQVDMEAEGEAEGQSEADVEAEVEAEAEAESEVDSEADSEAEAETEQEVESEAESEQELAADAEAIDDIMHELM